MYIVKGGPKAIQGIPGIATYRFLRARKGS